MSFNEVLIQCFYDKKYIQIVECHLEDDFFENADELKIWQAMKETNSNKTEDLFKCWDKQDRMKLLGVAMEMENQADLQRHQDEKLGEFS